MKIAGAFCYFVVAPLSLFSLPLEGAEECETESEVEKLYASRYTRTITSPGYPQSLRRRCSRSWRIMADNTELVRLTVDEVKMLHRGKHRCENDYIHIYNGFSVARPRLMTGFCYPYHPHQVFISSGPYMLVTFWTAGQNAVAFKLHYEAIQNPALPTTKRPYPTTSTPTGDSVFPVSFAVSGMGAVVCCICCMACRKKSDNSREQNEQPLSARTAQPVSARADRPVSARTAHLVSARTDRPVLARTAQPVSARTAQPVSASITPVSASARTALEGTSVGSPALTVHHNITTTFIVNTPSDASRVRFIPSFTDGHHNPGFASLEDEVSSAVNQTSPDQTVNTSAYDQSMDEPPSYSSLQHNTDTGASQARGLDSRTDELHEEPPPSYDESVEPPPTYDEVVPPSRRPPCTS